MGKKAIILGASGLVGAEVLRNVLVDPDFDAVIIFVRKELPVSHSKLTQHIINFNEIAGYSELIKADVVFCCLGSTMKKSGSKEAFRKVDFEYPYEFAKIAKQNGCEQFLVISSMGANKSGSNFYLKVKGDIEYALEKLNFRQLTILRPSMLLGDRKEFRLGEKVGAFIMKMISFAFIGKMKKYKAIEVSNVASAMIKLSKSKMSAINIVESDKLQKL